MKLIHENILHLYNLHCPVKTKFISPKDKEKLFQFNLQTYFRLFKRNSITKRVYKIIRDSKTGK